LAYFERRVQHEDAADLLGETCLQAWRRVDAIPDESPERRRMWLFTIATHVLANHRRATGRRLALADRLRERVARDGAPSVSDSIDTFVVRDAVARLSADQRDLVMLVHWDGFTIAEAAELLDVNPSTARGRYSTARVSLRDALVERSTC
jgi:RNA polymerase sigma-70 factor (ECF subfamily)